MEPDVCRGRERSHLSMRGKNSQGDALSQTCVAPINKNITTGPPPHATVLSLDLEAQRYVKEADFTD
jgi:hypothetical protein